MYVSIVEFRCGQKQFDIRRCPEAGFLSAKQKDSVASYIEKAAGLFGKLRVVQPEAIEIVLLDYLERTAFIGVSASNVCSFMRCIADGAFSPDVRDGKPASGGASPTQRDQAI